MYSTIITPVCTETPKSARKPTPDETLKLVPVTNSATSPPIAERTGPGPELLGGERLFAGCGRARVHSPLAARERCRVHPGSDRTLYRGDFLGQGGTMIGP
jgi:hypothetical protein